MASMMMVSANDAAYAIAEAVGGSIGGFADDANETARRYGMRDSTFGDPAGLTDETSYKGGPKVERVRPRDRGPQRADRSGDRAVGGHDRLRVHRSDRACTTRCTTTTSSCPTTASATSARTGSRPATRELAQHSLVATAEAQRPPVHRGDPRRGRRRLHVGRVAARPVLAEAARSRPRASSSRRSRCRRTRRAPRRRPGSRGSRWARRPRSAR